MLAAQSVGKAKAASVRAARAGEPVIVELNLTECRGLYLCSLVVSGELYMRRLLSPNTGEFQQEREGQVVRNE